jgi:putative transcriptional regulator
MASENPEKGDFDPLYTILRSKRETTRFQIMVEIASHQPAVRQQEIAEKLGVTPQAVSDYIRELVDNGMVYSYGRGRYEISKEGVEWVLKHSEALEAYAKHVNRDIIHKIAVWCAIADEDMSEGDTAGVYMKDGWLFATRTPQSANGYAVMDAKKGEDIGIARLDGIIDHTEGKIHVCKVPRVEKGGSRQIDLGKLDKISGKSSIIAAVGLEAYIALRKAGREPDMYFGAREGVIEAAFHGLESTILVVDNEFTDLLNRLEDAGISYAVHDLIIP